MSGLGTLFARGPAPIKIRDVTVTLFPITLAEAASLVERFPTLTPALYLGSPRDAVNAGDEALIAAAALFTRRPEAEIARLPSLTRWFIVGEGIKHSFCPDAGDPAEGETTATGELSAPPVASGEPSSST